MGDSNPDAADSRQRVVHTVALQSAALSPRIRVIELHILGIQVQLRSIKMGRHRRRPRLSSFWSPANAAKPDRELLDRARHLPTIFWQAR
jgi:hypothetical protein